MVQNAPLGSFACKFRRRSLARAAGRIVDALRSSRDPWGAPGSSRKRSRAPDSSRQPRTVPDTLGSSGQL
eukprot:9059006-Alexandrium_andersonii.AAC.1